MKYTISHHAGEMLRERRIDIEWVEMVLAQPALKEQDREDSSLEHWFAAIPERDGRVLRVVVNIMRTPVHVVTAYFDRAKRGIA